jgi:hypothetical protein
MKKSKGLFGKYVIQRSDGTPVDPKDEYFVLKVSGDGDPKHIEACRKAAITYANEIKGLLPELADDLISRYKV